MTTDEQYMQRCIELARKGAGSVAPNPMVGAVLVCNDEIIGEGWHQQYGQAHAEVNCVAAVIPTKEGSADQRIQHSTLYVSLEPCAHFGKTPPCSDLIIKHKIPKVVIGCRDPFKEVDGKGIEKLKAAGVEVIVDVLKDECIDLNKRFFTFHQQQRPYIILKWAQTKNGIMASKSSERLLISNEMTNRLVHQWRSEEASILVGTNTALLDDPQLTSRYWPGKQPVRLVLDKHLRLPNTLKLFNDEARTIIFNSIKDGEEGNVRYYQLPTDAETVPALLNALYQLNINSVLVEGGAQLLKSFIAAGLWDEARIITNEQLTVVDGLAAPQLTNAVQTGEQLIGIDRIVYSRNSSFITHHSL
ncbi:bifunctional diaminohydroxyphosphoribosylaminopyrimidine deaminase/5-amino-6-(5-phosphoribosylamino)uracil reductase RibD [Lacibacter sp. H407]|uniref:bifunctional diaminohydroxyphosphoribosylaminopyrimidine deaminase/5-amino-6-(5-phosphoribosylamino)uracil reductase RibD n=1 Tax=Lacibacter sp. H407 TaxID=3133423 RepID=UPI0030BAB5C3